MKTSGCITTMPLCSRLLLALNCVSAHSSQFILWIAILGCSVWTRRMETDCWQRAVAYNPSLPIGSACSIRRRKGAEAAERERGGCILQKKIALSCTPGSRLSLKFDIGLIGRPKPLLPSSVFSVAEYLLAKRESAL